MKTLQDWKDAGKAGIGWPVNGITPDTGGLVDGDIVIYNEAEGGKVYKEDKDGNVSIWGTVNSSFEDKIEGTIANEKGWSFEITCPGGLEGRLFQAFAVRQPLEGSHRHGHGSQVGHPRFHDDHDTEPTPGSWTAAEGGGTFHRERERERERGRERAAA